MTIKNLALLFLVFVASLVSAQTKPAAVSPGGDNPIVQLKSSLEATRAELEQCRREIDLLRQQVQELQNRWPGSAAASPAAITLNPASTYPTISITQAPPVTSPAVAQVEGDQELLNAKLSDIEQTKIESASHYRVKLSGLILMNAFSNAGHVDVQDLPNLAFATPAGQSRGDIGATLRQTLLGVDVSGPTLFGAASSASAQIDFFGGFPRMNYGATAGLLRLRTATARLDWHNVSVTVGQDAPFISPRSPTSYATLAEPAFSWSGNLWVWTPQVQVERRWQTSDQGHISWQAGILDPVTEDVPEQFNRSPNAGERSRMPALATRFGWSGMISGQPAGVGFGGYFGHQSYGFSRRVNSWAVTGDWGIPLGRLLELSGEVYRGQAIGGLGGGIWQSVLFNGPVDESASSVLGLNDIGGWSQLKLRLSPKLEWNAAIGLSNPFARDLHHFPVPVTDYEPLLSRNQNAFVNAIWRPRSNLLFAVEYRRLRSFDLSGKKNTADHVNLAAGVSF